MKRKLNQLPRRHTSALRRHLKQGPQASLQPARGPGVQAVKPGLKTLDQRTTHLAAANRSLSNGIARHKTAEKALRKSAGDSEKLLKESHRLQKHLRDLAHKIISTQENNRKQISHELQDEIVQTLLGINVRLLTLKNTAAANGKGLKKDIASTQRLVEESIRSINRFALELNPRQQP